jgi:hypothetical protein
MGLGFFGGRDLGAGLLLLRGRSLSDVSAPPGFCRALLVMEAIFCVAGVSCVNLVKVLRGIYGNFSPDFSEIISDSFTLLMPDGNNSQRSWITPP